MTRGSFKILRNCLELSGLVDSLDGFKHCSVFAPMPQRWEGLGLPREWLLLYWGNTSRLPVCPAPLCRAREDVKWLVSCCIPPADICYTPLDKVENLYCCILVRKYVPNIKSLWLIKLSLPSARPTVNKVLSECLCFSCVIKTNVHELLSRFLECCLDG